MTGVFNLLIFVFSGVTFLRARRPCARVEFDKTYCRRDDMFSKSPRISLRSSRKTVVRRIIYSCWDTLYFSKLSDYTSFVRRLVFKTLRSHWRTPSTAESIASVNFRIRSCGLKPGRSQRSEKVQRKCFEFTVFKLNKVLARIPACFSPSSRRRLTNFFFEIR